MLGRYFSYIWSSAEEQYKKEILDSIDENTNGKMLDLGCDDGSWTIQLAKKMKAKKGNIFGIDLIKERYKKAVKRGIIVKEADLNEKFPFKNNEFDLVHANQVIEHMWYLDSFVTEIKRVLKKGGYAIICTEHLSSWHNIIALLLGYQPFSITNISFEGAIGNPLALHSADSKEAGMRIHGSWHHTRVLSYQALTDIFKVHGFEIVYHKGFGYFPFPPVIANILSKFDPRHTAFPVLKVRKK